MNIQKGGEKNFLDYILKFKNANKTILDMTSSHTIKEVTKSLDKTGPVFIVCAGLGTKDQHACWVKEDVEKYMKIPRRNKFPLQNIIFIGCTNLKAFKTIRWLKFSDCNENDLFERIQNNNLITSTVETIQTLLDKDFKVCLMGHSFGGSVCNFVANNLKKNNNLKIFTYGSIYISIKAKDEHKDNMSNYMLEGDVALAKLAYKCLENKTATYYNDYIRKVKYEKGHLKDNPYEEDDMTKIDGSRNPIGSGTQWQIHCKYRLEYEILNKIFEAELFPDLTTDYSRLPPATPPATPSSSLGKKRSMRTRPLPAPPSAPASFISSKKPEKVEKEEEEIGKILVNIDNLYDSEKTFNMLETETETETGDETQTETKYNELMENLANEEFITTINALLKKSKEKTNSPNLNINLTLIPEQVTFLGLNRKKLKRKKTKRKKKPKKKKPSKKKK